jgi:integrase
VRKQLKQNVTVKKRRGREYHYYRSSQYINGQLRERYVRIKADPETPEYDRIYWEIRSGKHKPKQSKTTVAALIASYQATSKFRKLAVGTRRKYSPVLDQIGTKNGAKDATKISRSNLREVHEKYAETPRKADWYIQIFSILFTHAIDIEWMTHNPAKGISLYGPQKPMEPWPEWFQAEYTARATGAALTAFHVGSGTGQRPGDVVAMKWAHFDGEFMQVAQEKTKTRLTIYCPKKLQRYLATISRQGDHIFPKNIREGVGYDAVEKAFRAIRKDICKERPEAKQYTLHGLRYVAAVELAEAGCSDTEIQSVTGHKSLEMVMKYRSAARQKGLSKQAQQRREQTRGES